MSEQDFVEEKGVGRKGGQSFDMFVVQLLTWEKTGGNGIYLLIFVHKCSPSMKNFLKNALPLSVQLIFF